MSETSEISNDELQEDADGSDALTHISNYTADPSKVNHRIYVGNLKNMVNRQDLLTIFSKYGRIEAVSIQKGQYGFVQFEKEESTEKAALGEKGLLFKGCLIHIRRCTLNDHPREGKQPDMGGLMGAPRNGQRPPSPYRENRGPPRGLRPFSPPRGRSHPRRRSPPRWRSPMSRGRSPPRGRSPRGRSRSPMREYAEMIERRLKNIGLQESDNAQMEIICIKAAVEKNLNSLNNKLYKI